MYQIIKRISPETLSDIAHRLSKANRAEIALHYGKQEHQMEESAIRDALTKQIACEDSLFFILYDHKKVPQALGGVDKGGCLFMVITEDIPSAVYISWLREARQIIEELQAVVDNPVYCYSDSRNTASHRWYNFIGLRHDESRDIYLTDGKKEIPLYYYENTIPVAEPTA